VDPVICAEEPGSGSQPRQNNKTAKTTEEMNTNLAFIVKSFQKKFAKRKDCIVSLKEATVNK
jgi:hypothetical protein